MPYGDESVLVWDSALHTSTADVLTTAGDHGGIMDVHIPIRVIRVGALITTAIDSTGADPVVKFDRRITTGSDTGRGDGDVGAVTIPDDTAAGKYVWSDAIKIDLDVGDQVVPQVTTAATTAGGAQYSIVYQNRNETLDNEDDAVESA